MKKAFIAILSLLLILSFTACGEKNKKGVIELEGNYTTGYTWAYSEDPEGIVSIEESYAENKVDDEQMTGVPGIATFTLTGISEGDTVLTFTYAQQWEGGETGESATYQVHVDKNLNVTVD